MSTQVSNSVIRLSIKNLLASAIFYQIFVAVFVGLIGLQGMQAMLAGFSNSYQQRVLPLNELKSISDYYSVDILQAIQQVRDGSLDPYTAADSISESFEKINSGWEAYQSFSQSQEELEIQQELLPVIESGHEMINNIILQLELGATMEIHHLAETELYPAVNALVEGLGQLMDQLLVLIESDYNSQQSDYQVSLFLMIGLISFAALTSAAAGYYFSRNFLMRPLQSAMHFAYEISKGNLQASIKHKRNDEIGLLVGSLQKMQEELRGIVKLIQDNSQEVAAASEEFAVTTDAISQATGQQSNEATKISSAIQQMRESIHSVNQLTAEASDISLRSGNLASQGTEVFESVVHDIQEVARVSQMTSAAVESLGQHSSDITQVVTVIRDVAEQTNLLALNAAIEAARAGEQGRGFSVVADEVRHLAERTSTSTHEIKRIVDLITSGTSEVVEAMKSQVLKVEEAVRQAGHAGEVINEINLASRNAVDRVSQVSLALDEQAKTSSQVAASVEQIAEMSESNNHSSSEVAISSQRLAKLAGDLGQAVKRFNL